MNEGIVTIVSGLGGLIAILGPLFLFLFVFIRTRSLHVVMYRFWILFYGRQEIADRKVRECIEEETSLMYFRFMQGIHVKTIDECHRLIERARCHAIRITDIAACGHYFDLVDFEIKGLPCKGKRFVVFIWAMLLTLIIAVIISLMQSDRALLSFKATGRYFWLSAQYAQPVWPPEAKSLRFDECQNSLISEKQENRQGFLDEEYKILCSNFLKRDEVSSFLSKSIASQRWALGVWLGMVLWLLWPSIGFARKLWAAEKVLKQIEKRSGGSVDREAEEAL